MSAAARQKLPVAADAFLVCNGSGVWQKDRGDQ